MTVRRWLYLASVVVSFAVLASGLVAIARKPTESKPVVRALAPAPVAVTLDLLDTGGQVMLGRTLLVRVEAIGPDLVEIALWEDDRVVDRFEPDQPANGIGHTFSWLALRPGTHLLHASARGSGGTARSAPISLEVMITSNTPSSLPVVVPVAVTPAQFAREHGIPPALVTVVDPSAPIESVPEGSTALLVDAKGLSEHAAAELARSGSTTGSDDRTEPAATDPTESSPVLEVSRSDCELRIAAKGARTPLAIYQATSGSPGFEQVGVAQPSEPLTLGRVGPGTYVFVAGPEGEPTTTAPTAVVVPGECIKSLWSGDSSIVNGILTLPKPDKGNLWLYLSVDDQPAQRVPASTLQTFRAQTRQVNVRHLLPSLQGSKIHLEVWSYIPGKDAATRIGTGDARLPDGVTPAMLIGESSSVSLTISPQKAKVADTKITAKWSSLSNRVDRVLWQVTTQPVSQADNSLFPLGTVATGLAFASGAGTKGGGRSGQFTIPIDAVLKSKPTPLKAKPLALGQLQQSKPVVNLPTAVAPIVNSVGLVDLAAADQWMTSNAEVVGGLVDNQPVVSGTTYYIRVVPFAGAAPLMGASPSVRFDGPTPTIPPQVAMDMTTVDVSAGRAANPALAACVRVTKLPWTGYDPKQFYSAFFPSLGTYCPGDWKTDDSCWAPEIFCDAWNYLVQGVTWLVEIGSKIWDAIAYIYNGIIDLAATLVSKLNPYCLAAAGAAYAAGKLEVDKKVKDLTKQVSDTCEKVGKVIAKATISAVLVAFGLPPELPTSQQLASMAEGNLTEFAVGYLKDLGVPCDDLVLDSGTAGTISSGIEKAGGTVPAGVSDGVDVCRDMVKAVVSEIKAAVTVQVQNQIANATGLPLPFVYIKGFEFSLEPRGSYRTPSLLMIATPREPSAPADARCDLWVSPTQVTLDPAKDKSTTFQPGKVVLTKWLGGTWFGSGRFPFNPKSGYGPEDYDLAAGAPVRIDVSSSCLADGKDRKFVRVIEPVKGRWKPGEAD